MYSATVGTSGRTVPMGTFCRIEPALPCALALAVALSPLTAQGDTPKKADDLFKQGIAKMKEGDFEAGCPLLADSLAIDYGMAAEFRLAECYEKQGKTASAWRSFRSVQGAAEKAKQRARARVAQKRADKLEAQLHRLTIKVPSSIRGLNGLQLLLNDQPIPSDRWGKARAIDPGKHVLSVRAPGYKDWTTTLNTSPTSKTQTVHLPQLELKASPKPQVQRPATPPAEKKLNSRWVGGLVAGGGGILVMGVGGVLGLIAKSSYDSAGERCTDNGCNAEGLTIRDKARTTGLVGSILVGVGAAATATGAILWITAPRYDEPTSAIGIAPTLGGASLQWKGRFE
jgi:hypothetical protein